MYLWTELPTCQDENHAPAQHPKAARESGGCRPQSRRNLNNFDRRASLALSLIDELPHLANHCICLLLPPGKRLINLVHAQRVKQSTETYLLLR